MPMITSAAIPPTTPPTMAPMFVPPDELPPLELSEADVLEETTGLSMTISTKLESEPTIRAVHLLHRFRTHWPSQTIHLFGREPTK